jgi:hypothetical protein
MPEVRPVNVIQMPQAPAPINKVYVQAPAHLDASRSDAALEKLIDLGQRALDFFMNRKPVKRNIEIKFDGSGNVVKGTSTEEKR